MANTLDNQRVGLAVDDWLAGYVSCLSVRPGRVFRAFGWTGFPAECRVTREDSENEQPKVGKALVHVETPG